VFPIATPRIPQKNRVRKFLPSQRKRYILSA
jgi:hypothetical protein